jgi:hypothetical protein
MELPAELIPTSTHHRTEVSISFHILTCGSFSSNDMNPEDPSVASCSPSSKTVSSFLQEESLALRSITMILLLLVEIHYPSPKPSSRFLPEVSGKKRIL